MVAAVIAPSKQNVERVIFEIKKGEYASGSCIYEQKPQSQKETQASLLAEEYH